MLEYYERRKKLKKEREVQFRNKMNGLIIFWSVIALFIGIFISSF